MRRAFAKSAAFVDGLPLGATVSVGAASDLDLHSDLNALFRRADAALYVAKRGGRDRVEFLAPEDDAMFEPTAGMIRNAPPAPVAPPKPVAVFAEAKLRA